MNRTALFVAVSLLGCSPEPAPVPIPDMYGGLINLCREEIAFWADLADEDERWAANPDQSEYAKEWARDAANFRQIEREHREELAALVSRAALFDAKVRACGPLGVAKFDAYAEPEPTVECRPSRFRRWIGATR
jgi:hypothetical protein